MSADSPREWCEKEVLWPRHYQTGVDNSAKRSVMAMTLSDWLIIVPKEM